MRAIWQSGGALATAYAFPMTRELIFSGKLLEICTDEEVAGICSHELAHLNESKTTKAGRTIGSLAYFPLLFVNPAFEASGVGGIFTLILGVWLIALLGKQVARAMEKRADAVAVQAQVDSGVYARALEKLYCVNQIPAVTAGKGTVHPHLYDRMLSAGITPDYPRPNAPGKITSAGWLLNIIFYIMLVKWLVLTRSG